MGRRQRHDVAAPAWAPRRREAKKAVTAHGSAGQEQQPGAENGARSGRQRRRCSAVGEGGGGGEVGQAKEGDASGRGPRRQRPAGRAAERRNGAELVRREKAEWRKRRMQECVNRAGVKAAEEESRRSRAPSMALARLGVKSSESRREREEEGGIRSDFPSLCSGRRDLGGIRRRQPGNRRAGAALRGMDWWAPRQKGGDWPPP